MKIYRNKENRNFVRIKEADGKYHTHSYARYLMEQHIDRKLNPDEEVHHIDEDKTNDVIKNLEIINSTNHRRHHNPFKYQDTIEKCYICGKNFNVTAKQHRAKFTERNRKPNSIGKYFCSRRCSGIYGKQIQEHLQEKSVE